MKTIVFDENSANWSGGPNWNPKFLKQREFI